MTSILALADLAPPIQDLLDGVAKFTYPSREQYVSAVEALTALQAAALVAAGVVYLLFGMKVFKTLVIINAAAIGGLLGAVLGEKTGYENMPLYMGLAGAVLAGAISWPLMHWAVGVMGALAGGLIGYGAWAVVAQAAGNEGVLDFCWAGGVLGMVIVGMLTFIVFNHAVMILTAAQGALMAVTGLCALLLTHSGIGADLHGQLVNNHYLLAILIGVPAVVGYTIQSAGGGHKDGKKPKPAGKPAS